MTATTVDTLEQRSKLGWAVQDALAVAHRNLLGLFRTPTTLVFSTVQPVIFVLMFRYVFGGSIDIPGYRYVDYLMAGIFVQTVTFGSINTGIGLAEDLSKGLIERFRSLAMARSAVLAGRTLADAVRNLIVIVLMVTVGFLVGFRVHTSVLGLLGAVALMLLFGFAMSWVMALIGLSTGTPRPPRPPRSRSWPCWFSPATPSCRRGTCPGRCGPTPSINRSPPPSTACGPC
jgi:hypothetical protein